MNRHLRRYLPATQEGETIATFGDARMVRYLDGRIETVGGTEEDQREAREWAVLRNRKRRIERRLAPRNWEDQPQPMMGGSNIHYELSGKIGATSYGGMGAVHAMVQSLGLVREIDQHLELLKVHLPYHESDHVLNIAYNILSAGERLEDIELRRQDESFLNGLGAQRIPDPTTAGDFRPSFRPPRPGAR